MEQPLFAPGDRVVCVDSKSKSGMPTGLIEGNKYTVMAIKRNACCGRVVIDVGLLNPSGYERCTKCDISIKSNVAWKHQYRFVPEDFDRYADNELHQALKGIPETL